MIIFCDLEYIYFLKKQKLDIMFSVKEGQRGLCDGLVSSTKTHLNHNNEAF